jgi:prepilin-type N-terminal cleavage/methylation domain-containing protein
MKHCPTRTKLGQQNGYSLVELLLAVTVILILAAVAIPNTATAIANIKLRGSASDFANLVQQARIAAVRKNATYTVLIGLPSGNGAYIDLNANASYDATLSPAIGGYSSEPMIQFGGNVNQVAAPGGASGAPTNLDASGGPLGWTATSGNISFNNRGLPCSTGSTPCATNVNYIFYFKDTRAFSANGWAAVSITAAARSKVWYWNGSGWAN